MKHVSSTEIQLSALAERSLKLGFDPVWIDEVRALAELPGVATHLRRQIAEGKILGSAFYYERLQCGCAYGHANQVDVRANGLRWAIWKQKDFEFGSTILEDLIARVRIDHTAANNANLCLFDDALALFEPTLAI